MNLTTTPKPFVFVLMPFRPDFNVIYAAIKDACDDAGAYCERVDEQHFDGSTVERIYNQIAKADVTVSEMTGKSPNVFYETGYAHALGKRAILLTQDTEDIPYNLKHYPHIAYEISNLEKMRVDLGARLRWSLDNPGVIIQDPINVLDFLVNGVEVQESSIDLTIALPSRNATPDEMAQGVRVRSKMRLKIDIHNRLKIPFDASGIQIALEVPSIFTSAIAEESVPVSQSRSLVLGGTLGRFLPDSWTTTGFTFASRQLSQMLERDFDVSLVVFTPFGKREMPFRLRPM